LKIIDAAITKFLSKKALRKDQFAVRNHYKEDFLFVIPAIRKIDIVWHRKWKSRLLYSRKKIHCLYL